MHDVTEILESHPQARVTDALRRCIEECARCDVACTSCADADLAEKDLPDLVRCIRLDLDCADVCHATGRVLTRQTSFEPRLARPLLEACVQACRVCAEECERHADHHVHCRICAEVCRSCEQACEDLLASLGT
jgi:hypothetical protein